MFIVKNDSTGIEERPMNSVRYEHKRFSNARVYWELVQKAAFYYDNMSELRLKWRRANDLVMGRQLDEMITYNGHPMRLRDYIEMRNLPAYQNDIISDKVKTLLGLIRQQYTAPICKAVDADGDDYVGLFNELIRQNDNNNDRQEMDAQLFRRLLVYGFICLKDVWDFRQGRQDIWNDMPDIYKLALPPFYKYDLSDVDFIAEAHDVSWGDILEEFCESSADEEKLKEIFGTASVREREQSRHGTGLNQTEAHASFYHSSIEGKYRVIELWTLERRRRIWMHDPLKADCGYVDVRERRNIERENEARRERNVVKDELGYPVLDELGEIQYYVDPETYEKENLIDWKYKVEQYWYVRFLSPNGYLLKEGISPYKVTRGGFDYHYHPYTFLAVPCQEGEVRSMVMETEDKQRALNRYMLTMDFVVSNSTKGGIAVDKEALTEEMDYDDIRMEYSKPDGVVIYSSKRGGAPPQPLKNAGTPAGIDFVIKMAEKLMQSQTGVQPALQGIHQTSTATQNTQEINQSATTVNDVIDSFNSFKKREAKKKLWTMQCYYTSAISIKVTGEDVRQYFDPEKMSDIDLDVALDLDTRSSIVRGRNDNMLWQLQQLGKISPLGMLENGDFPGTERLKRYFKRQEEEQQAAMMQQGAAGGMMPMQPTEQRAPSSLSSLEDQGNQGVVTNTK